MAKKSRPSTTDAPVSNGSSRFRSSVLIAAMLFAPAAFLVLRGNLSVNEALVRFGCALLFAMVGTAIVVSSMPVPGGSEGDAPGSAGGSSTSDQAAGSAASAPLGGVGLPVAQPVG